MEKALWMEKAHKDKETAKGPIGLQFKLPSARQPTPYGGGLIHIAPFIAECQAEKLPVNTMGGSKKTFFRYVFLQGA